MANNGELTVKNPKKPRGKPFQSGNKTAALGGRPKGSLNKATAEIRELAQQYVPEVFPELVRIALHGETEAARVAAIKEILDRAYGKSPQAVTGDNGPLRIVLEYADRAL